VVAEEVAQAATVAHQAAVASNVQSAAWPLDADGDAAASGDLSDSGGPVIALQWTKVRCGEMCKKIERPRGRDELPPMSSGMPRCTLAGHMRFVGSRRQKRTTGLGTPGRTR
jgi:hypothetical protein